MKFGIFYFLVFVFFIGLFSSCNNKKSRVDISTIDIGTFKIDRYERDLFRINPDSVKQGLEAIQQKYKVFLAADLNDSDNINQIKDFISDTGLIRIYRETEKKFPDLDALNSELKDAFKYYRYYFPKNPIPVPYTYISGLQYEYPVQITDSVLIIALDLYLGADFNLYRQIGLPEYKIERMQPPYIAVDCMKELAIQLLPPSSKNPTFLDAIINWGKIMYFLDVTLPDKEDYLKIGFAPEKLNWCFENESRLWAFIIENQVLFSSDSELIRKFTNDGPFTAAFSNKSPARIGVWIGWQIVRSYMKNHPEVTVPGLFMDTNNQQLFTLSKYKP